LEEQLIILFFTICCFSLSLILPGPRDWLQSVKRKPFPAFLISISIVAAFLGSITGANFADPNPVDTTRALRIGFITIMGTVALLAFFFNNKTAKASGSLGWMAAYAFLAMFSATYSVYPLLSLYKGYEVAAFVTLGLFAGTLLHTWQDVEDLVNIMLLILWYLVVSAIFGVVVSPSEVLGNKLLEDSSMAFGMGGVFPAINASSLTQISGILSACSLCWWFNRSKSGKNMGVALVFVCTTIVMFLAHSRTSLFAFIVAGCLVFISYRKVGLSLFFGGLATILTILSDYLVVYFLRGQTPKQFTQLSGRMYFWPLVFEYVKQSPIIGHGFYASQRLLLGRSSVDNSYLEVLLGMGLIGLTVFCMAVLGVALNLWRSRPLASGRNEIPDHQFIWTELAVIFIFLFMRSLTGPSFQNLHFNLTLFILVTVCAAAACRLKKRALLEQREATGAAARSKAGMVPGMEPLPAQRRQSGGIYRRGA